MGSTTWINFDIPHTSTLGMNTTGMVFQNSVVVFILMDLTTKTKKALTQLFWGASGTCVM